MNDRDERSDRDADPPSVRRDDPYSPPLPEPTPEDPPGMEREPYSPEKVERGMRMATDKQKRAARKNVKQAQAGARSKQTLKKLPKKTRTALGKEANKVRKGEEPTRKELEASARRLKIRGRSKMGKAELKRAVRRARG